MEKIGKNSPDDVQCPFFSLFLNYIPFPPPSMQFFEIIIMINNELTHSSSFPSSPFPGFQVINLIVDLVNHLMERFHGEQINLDIIEIST